MTNQTHRVSLAGRLMAACGAGLAAAVGLLWLYAHRQPVRGLSGDTAAVAYWVVPSRGTGAVASLFPGLALGPIIQSSGQPVVGYLDNLVSDRSSCGREWSWYATRSTLPCLYIIRLTGSGETTDILVCSMQGPKVEICRQDAKGKIILDTGTLDCGRNSWSFGGSRWGHALAAAIPDWKARNTPPAVVLAFQRLAHRN